MMMKRILKILFYLFVMIQITDYSASHFQKDQLYFDNGVTGFVPSTPNLTNSATKIVGGLILENGNIIAGNPKTLVGLVAPFVGIIMPVAVTSNAKIPGGWLPCDGRVVSQNAYPLLFQRIGTKWGTTTKNKSFVLPNLNGYFLRGRDKMSVTGTAAGRDTTYDVGTSVSSSIASHTHPTNSNLAQNTDPAAAHFHITQTSQPFRDDSEEEDNDGLYTMNNNSSTEATGASTSAANHTHTFLSPNGTISGGGGSEMLPKRMYLIYCIKVSPF